jgi:hypothetical protein
MSTRDLLLIELYHTWREEQELALVARHAPLLRFDAREPFLPFAAGYTIFSVDGPSPSMQRQVRLAPPGKPAAARAIEYAIWWDWDIHHLYELEHIWVYLDALDHPLRVEASWHGEYREIPLQLENGRAVLFSEPGKHAFAPTPDWFRQRTAEMRRIETLDVGAHASVLVNTMFAGRIRQQAFDQTLVRSFLCMQAFVPTWDFSKQFSFHAEWLVPWSVLEEWIPRRVNTCLDRLEEAIRPEDYHPLRLFGGGETLDSLQTAALAGAEGLFLPVHCVDNRLRLGLSSGAADIEDAYNFCISEPIAAVCAPVDLLAVESLADFLQSKGLGDSLVMTFTDPDCLARCLELIPNAVCAIQLTDPAQDPLQAAEACGARYLHLNWGHLNWGHLPNPGALLNASWVERVHRSGLGIISWPVKDVIEAARLSRLGVDFLWQTPAVPQ